MLSLICLDYKIVVMTTLFGGVGSDLLIDVCCCGAWSDAVGIHSPNLAHAWNS